MQVGRKQTYGAARRLASEGVWAELVVATAEVLPRHPKIASEKNSSKRPCLSKPTRVHVNVDKCERSTNKKSLSMFCSKAMRTKGLANQCLSHGYAHTVVQVSAQGRGSEGGGGAARGSRLAGLEGRLNSVQTSSKTHAC